MFSLEYVLGSVYPVFFDKYWGKRAVVIPGDEDKFAEVFSWSEVNHYLNYSRSNFDGMRLLLDKQELPRNDLANAKKWLENGATLVINSIGQIDPVVKRLSSMIARELNTQVNTNCYASYTSKQGFDTHFDEHDVFIIQAEGTKVWAVFEPTIAHPLHIQHPPKNKLPVSDPYIEYEMTKGDVLYIPRGHWHHAIALTPSVHLTMGPQSRSAIEFLQWALNQLMHNDEFFRKDLPIADADKFGGKRTSNELEAHLDEVKNRFLKIFNDQVFTESVVQYAMNENPIRSDIDLPNSWNSDNIVGKNTRFVLHPEQKAIVRYDSEKQGAVVFFRGQKVELNGVPEGMMNHLFNPSGEGFSVAEILSLCPDLESVKVKAVFVELLNLGALVVDQ